MNGPPDDQVQGSVGQSNIWTITLRSMHVSRFSVEAPTRVQYNEKYQYSRKSAMGDAPNYNELARSQLDARRSEYTRALLSEIRLIVRTIANDPLKRLSDLKVS
jgi:hypothetical protein